MRIAMITSSLVTKPIASFSGHFYNFDKTAVKMWPIILQLVGKRGNRPVAKAILLLDIIKISFPSKNLPSLTALSIKSLSLHLATYRQPA